MMDKHTLLSELLQESLIDAKIGLLVKGMWNVVSERIVSELSEKMDKHIYVAAVGYDGIAEKQTDSFTITLSVEQAVAWRSNPDYSGSIVVFVKNDSEKLHSLSEFEVISARDLTRYLIARQIRTDGNAPTNDFWNALKQTSDYYSFDVAWEFVQAVNAEKNMTEAIPENMWRLNLLCDKAILGTKSKPEDRLSRNRELIFAIAQLSEDSRKKLIRSLSKTKLHDKLRLETAYSDLHNFYNYGKKDILKNLDYDTVQELFSASKKDDSIKKKSVPSTDPVSDLDEDITSSTPIRPKELDKLISDVIVSGDEEKIENIKTLLSELKKHFDPEVDDNNDSVPAIGGIFNDRNIVIDNHQSDLRKLVGKVCSSSIWGGLMKTEESVLKDAISADIKSFSGFDPIDCDSIIAFKGGIDGSQALFDFLIQFDVQFDVKEIETAERFKPVIEKLRDLRNVLIENLDMIMYYPVLSFGADEGIRQAMLDYTETWAKLYHAFCVNEPIMRQISAGGTSFVAKALLLLDVLYVKTPKEWKGILLPMHPIYLWRYYEIFKSLPAQRAYLRDDEANALTEVLNQLPQILSFLIANSLITETSDDKILPCSGNIEMLPTFENKTNRYLGDDGNQSIEEVLTRWVGFAPYTRNEVRVCSVDAPDLISNIRALKSFMDKNNCRRVVYDVYLTRRQNGNTELSKLDYSGKDYEIGEFIRQDKISISIRNVESAHEVKLALSQKPVHVAFYFDQSAYAIEFGPNNKSLYINPLVVTYDYDFDEIQHRGSIFPSSEMDSGLIGDYHKLMKSADVISNSMNPRTTYNGNADMTAVVSTISDRQTQWLVAADRDTNNYDPQQAIPIGERQYDKRTVNIWASSDSRIISQYLALLRSYNLYPTKEALTDILKRFGHITSNGLISIPRFGADAQAIENKKKGLIGTLFAASWYARIYKNSLIASLDDDKARLWLYDSRFGNERADLVGLRYDETSDTLFIQPIEVKTRDESPDATITKDEIGRNNIVGHAGGQIAAVVGMLREIFAVGADSTDMFISARREVLKYQIVSECFRNIHDPSFQKKWYEVLKKAFGIEKNKSIKISISGLLLHIKLSAASGGEHKMCVHPDFDDCEIEYRRLTAKEIQAEIFGTDAKLEEAWTPESSDTFVADDEAIVDKDKDYRVSDVISNENIEDKMEDSIATQSTSVPIQGTDSLNVYTAFHAAPASVLQNEIEQLVKDFKRACGDYHINLRECDAESSVVGPSVIRLNFKLGRGQALQGLLNHLEDIGRDMKRSGVIVQPVFNSDELMLDIPRRQREKVLFKDVISLVPRATSPEELWFPLGRTPNGRDLMEDLGQLPHMLVGGSTGSGKSVFLFSMLATLLMTHPKKKDLQLVLSSSKLEDFIHFEGLPHLFSGQIISDAMEATRVIKEVIFEESEKRGRLLAEARVANIIEYNKKEQEKLAPIVVVIDEFADLADQLESKKDQNAFYKPVQRIAQAGRSRGIHLVICTQRPEAKLVPSTTKAQLNGRVALRVNDGISSRMIIESPDAQYLQKHGDMIYKNGDTQERAQGYLIEIDELKQIVNDIINGKYQ